MVTSNILEMNVHHIPPLCWAWTQAPFHKRSRLRGNTFSALLWEHRWTSTTPACVRESLQSSLDPEWLWANSFCLLSFYFHLCLYLILVNASLSCPSSSYYSSSSEGDIVLIACDRTTKQFLDGVCFAVYYWPILPSGWFVIIPSKQKLSKWMLPMLFFLFIDEDI